MLQGSKATLGMFYLEAYKGHSNLAIQRHTSITFHNSHKLFIKHTWGKFYMLFNARLTNILTHSITSHIRAQLIACSHIMHYGVSTQLSPFSLFSLRVNTKRLCLFSWLLSHWCTRSSVTHDVYPTIHTRFQSAKDMGFILLLLMNNLPLRWSSSIYPWENHF